MQPLRPVMDPHRAVACYLSPKMSFSEFSIIVQSFLQIFHFSWFSLNGPELKRSKIKENQSKLILFAYMNYK